MLLHTRRKGAGLKSTRPRLRLPRLPAAPPQHHTLQQTALLPPLPQQLASKREAPLCQPVSHDPLPLLLTLPVPQLPSCRRDASLLPPAPVLLLQQKQRQRLWQWWMSLPLALPLSLHNLPHAHPFQQPGRLPPAPLASPLLRSPLADTQATPLRAPCFKVKRAAAAAQPQQAAKTAWAGHMQMQARLLPCAQRRGPAQGAGRQGGCAAGLLLLLLLLLRAALQSAPGARLLEVRGRVAAWQGSLLRRAGEVMCQGVPARRPSAPGWQGRALLPARMGTRNRHHSRRRARRSGRGSGQGRGSFRDRDESSRRSNWACRSSRGTRGRDMRSRRQHGSAAQSSKGGGRRSRGWRGSAAFSSSGIEPGQEGQQSKGKVVLCWLRKAPAAWPQLSPFIGCSRPGMAWLQGHATGGGVKTHVAQPLRPWQVSKLQQQRGQLEHQHNQQLQQQQQLPQPQHQHQHPQQMEHQRH